jgi:NADPH:quinone reductase-like Zn-dependent oxidoreductase
LDGEVLLQVHAAGIHAGTPLIAAGIPWVMRLALGGLRAPPPDSIAGTEVAGKVVAIGSNVKTLKVGDAVFGEIVLTRGVGLTLRHFFALSIKC